MPDILKLIRKNIGLSVSLSAVAVGAICGAVKAAQNDSSSSSAQTDSSSSSSSSSSGSSGQTALTNEEIDKVIEDLKISGSIDNIIEKLDEIIYRAQLSGNTALREYAENMKNSYELQKQLDSVNTLIEAMKKKNTDIAAVDDQVKKILSVDTISSDLDGAVSDEALLVIKSLSNDSSKQLQETLAEVESLVDLKDVGSLTVRQRSLLDIILLSKIIEDGMVEDERLQLAKDTLAVAVTILESYQKQNYPQNNYNTLVEGTQRFISSAKKASSVLPEQVVFFDGHFDVTHPPIMYDGHILMAVDDLYKYIDATIEYMYNNSTMVITSPNKILEIVSGQNVAYLNDKPYNMPVPILSFEDTTYMPVEFFAQAYDISYKWLADHDFIVLYKNLVQLGNPSVPNQLSKG